MLGLASRHTQIRLKSTILMKKIIHSALALIFLGGVASAAVTVTFDQVATWNDKTFASLSLLPGTYSYVWAGDSLNIVVPVVPEPSALGLVLGAFACVALRRRRA